MHSMLFVKEKKTPHLEGIIDHIASQSMYNWDSSHSSSFFFPIIRFATCMSQLWNKDFNVLLISIN